jgi:phosphonate transport system substrate-binding protein
MPIRDPRRNWTQAAGLAPVVMAVLLSLGGCGAEPAAANPNGDWRSGFRELRFAVQGDEVDPQRAARWDAYRDFLTEVTGVQVRVFETSDYNGTIQAIAAGQVDIAQMGPGSYANVDDQVGGLVAPILLSRQAEGNTGYYSAMMVKASSPYRSLADLRGRTLAFVDFNSTSGYIYPSMKMRSEGIDPDTFFAKTLMAGGHTQSMLALANGQVDATLVNVSGGTPEAGFTTGTHITLARQGMLDLEDYRLIWTAGPMPNSPVVMRTDRPQALIDLVRGALAAMPFEEPEIWTEIAQLQGSTFVATDRRTYEDVIALRTAQIAERRGLGPEGSRQ